MHEPDEKFNAACYFKKNLYDDKEWQARNGVSLQDCWEVMILLVVNVHCCVRRSCDSVMC